MIEPWSKFYWSDYDADEGLRMCSLAAQGLWMRMLCLMARATPKGELRVGGEPCTVTDLARAVGESEEMVASLLGELARRGVSSATRAGVIYSRRLRKDAEISRKRAISGKKGGMASLGKIKEKTACLSKNQANMEAKHKPQKPEARYSVSNETGVPPPDLVKVVFDHGVHLLTAQGHSDRDARKIIGKWRKDCRDDKLVRDALVEAASRNISNLVEWVPKYLGNQPVNPLDVLLEQSDRFARRAA